LHPGSGFWLLPKPGRAASALLQARLWFRGELDSHRHLGGLRGRVGLDDGVASPTDHMRHDRQRAIA